MRVLFVTHSFPRWVGDPPGSFLLRLARALADRSVEVTVVAPAAAGLPSTDRFDGVQVVRYRYAPRPWETLAYTGGMVEDVRRSLRGKLAMAGLLGASAAAVRRAVAALRPAVVHAHWWFPGGLAAAAGGAGATPLVTTLHGTDVRMARTIPASVPLLRRVLHRSATVTVVSRYLADEVSRLVPGIAPDVAPMPAATELFTPPAGGGGRDGLLFVGRLNAQKGIAPLLRALALLTPDVTLDIVGDGPDRDQLQELARTLGVAPRVRWRGTLPQERLAERYRAAMALVVPSVQEGLGLVAVEALLCETPVVAYRSGGLVDVVEHGANGVLLEPGDPASLADAMRGLLADPSLAASLGRAGRAAMLSRFSPERVSDRYVEVYERSLAHSGHGGRGG